MFGEAQHVKSITTNFFTNILNSTVPYYFLLHLKNVMQVKEEAQKNAHIKKLLLKVLKQKVT